MNTLNIEVSKDQILGIVQEVFAAMLDMGETLMFEATKPTDPVDSLHAWVDMKLNLAEGPLTARAILCTSEETAQTITRTLLMTDEDEDVSFADLADALGEIANMVGGNVKSLVQAPSELSMPVVSKEKDMSHEWLFLQDLHLVWRSQPLSVSLWVQPTTN